jgi:hypothetical protein
MLRYADDDDLEDMLVLLESLESFIRPGRVEVAADLEDDSSRRWLLIDDDDRTVRTRI